MYITNYQMHNVLKVYTNQLSQCRVQIPDSLAGRKPTAAAIDVSTGGKRQDLIERIASHIVARIRNGGSQDNSKARITENPEEEPKAPSRAPNGRNAPFIYNVIRGAAEKKTKHYRLKMPVFRPGGSKNGSET